MLSSASTASSALGHHHGMHYPPAQDGMADCMSTCSSFPTASQPDMDTLFQKQVPISLKTGGQQRRQWVTVTVGITSKPCTPASTNGRLKVLRVTLTDDSDPFFLYQLDIGEDDFHQLKSEQNLLVDFADFPVKFIELLEECIRAGSDDRAPESLATGTQPKFLAQLQSQGPQSVLTVVETNSFKHITHLALQFVPGTDASIKKYLATLVHQFKEQSAALKGQLQRTQEQLKSEVQVLAAENQCLKQTVDSLRFEAADRESRLKLQHAEDLAAERERWGQQTSSVARDLESSKSSLVARYEQQLGASTSQTQVASLSTRNSFLDEQLAACKHSLSLATAESDRARQELSTLQHEKTDFLNCRYELEKSVASLQKRCEGLEQCVQDKSAVIGRLEDLVNSHNSQSGKMEESVNLYKRQHLQLEQQLASANAENSKANEIIAKLHAELKTSKSKLKLKNVVTTQQEKLLDEKQHSMDSLQKECGDLKEILAKKDSEMEVLAREKATLVNQVSEDKKAIEDNNNVIEWLHKQLNEEALAKRPLSSGFPDLSSRVEYKRGTESMHMNRQPISRYSSSVPMSSSAASMRVPMNSTLSSSAKYRKPEEPLGSVSSVYTPHPSVLNSSASRMPLRSIGSEMQSVQNVGGQHPLQQALSKMALHRDANQEQQQPVKSNYF